MITMRNAGSRVLDLLFPRRCPWCGQVVGFSADGCNEKTQKLALAARPIGWVGPGTAVPNLASAWACFSYEEPVNSAIVRMKYENEPALAEDLGMCLAHTFQTLCKEGQGMQFDAIVPVPVSKTTLRKRGYNQTELLAAVLARQTGLPVRTDLLRKVRETRQQMTLTRIERRQNVQNAYAAEEAAKGLSILLLDDVLTTGSTLDECAKCLQAAGAAACAALCVAASLPKEEGKKPMELA